MDLARAWSSVDGVVDGLSAIESAWKKAGDRRVVFASVYRMMSEAMRARLGQGAFEDDAWVARYTAGFANLYRAALRDYEAGAAGSVPKAWRMSFDASRSGAALVVQDLLLGVNAHINHDLALALRDVGIAPRAGRRRDHEAVNRVLGAITDDVQAKVAAMYARGLGDADRWAGRLDEDVAGFGLTAARENAWTLAVALTSARLELERRLIRGVLDRSSGLVARGILALSGNPPLAARLREVERGLGWSAMWTAIWCS